MLKKVDKLASNIPFNYPGLRIETKSINIKKIENYSPRILCFGDSVTFGWNLIYNNSYPAILENLLKTSYPDLKIINSGVGGNTIIDGNKRFVKDTLPFKPNLVIINFGLNDGMLSKKHRKKMINGENLFFKEGNKYYYPAVGMSLFEKYYLDLLKNAENYEMKLVILGINPVLDNFPEGQSNDFKKRQKDIYFKYDAKITEIAEENGINYVNLWDVFDNENAIQDYMQTDGVHPNEKGQALIAKQLFNKISNLNIFINQK
ncbi:MAG: SGNH/GDSL hydrolase family protein [Cyanobacteria bacterium]|nr:SGNH/GDSL hydrolase family protein [Cyanobacteriota bacterium]